MFRATTPKHTFIFDVDPDATFKEILVTYAQNGQVILNKRKEDMTFSSGTDVDGNEIWMAVVQLTQTETNLFKTKNGPKVSVQLRVLTTDDEAFAFDKMTVSLQDVLNDEVLE